MRSALLTLTTLAAAACLVAGSASGDSNPIHRPMYMPNAHNVGNPALQPPPVCCVPGPPFAAGAPAPGNMAYFGGHVQVQPKIYLVFWGWGEPGAFDHTTPGAPTYRPGRRSPAHDRVHQGARRHGLGRKPDAVLRNRERPEHQHPECRERLRRASGTTTRLRSTTTSSGLELAQEAQRAVTHFGVTDLHNAQFVIAQPQKDNEAGFNSGAGYCAWHDYTQPEFYPGVQPGISFTNMPYVLNSGASCGQNSVNSGFYTGRLDGFSIVLGHEVEETITDPGAEDVINGVNLGGWYDVSGWENGDKCAWVGYAEGIVTPSTVPGGLNNIVGNDGKPYPVQSLWSNDSAGGVGYCAGASDDLPVTG